MKAFFCFVPAKQVILLSAIVIVVLTSCDRDKAEEPKPHGSGSFKLHLHHMVGAQVLAPNTNYTVQGRAVQFSIARYIVSNVEAIDANGNAVALQSEGFVVDGLLNGGVSLIDLGKLPQGSYRGLRFVIGLDSATNHQDPTVLPQTHPLSRPDMHWAWNPAAGYIFVRVEGLVDTNATPDGTAEGTLKYHLATNAMRTPITSLQQTAFTVGAHGAKVHLSVKLENLFANVTLPAEILNHSMPPQMAMAARLQQSFNSLFESR